MWRRWLLMAGVIVGACSAAGGYLALDARRPAAVRNEAEDPSEAASIQAAAAEIDAAFEAEWERLGLVPAEAAAELTVARRLSLALQGTTPSLEEVRRFEVRRDGERLSTRLEELLADRRTADYLAERFARSYVGVKNGAFILYRRRRFVTWLADQIEKNRPYDALVRELVAEEGLWTDRPAVNFITAAITPDTDRDPEPPELAARTARAFLGVRIDCAECHDHPFDRWKQEDFHRLAAFYGEAKRGALGIRDGEATYRYDDRATGSEIEPEPAVPFAAELLPSEGRSRERLARWITDPRNEAFTMATANRAWALMFGRPLVEPVDGVLNGQEPPAALRLLARDFAEHGFDLQRMFRVIAATRVFRLESRLPEGREVTPEHGQAWAMFPVVRLRPEQVAGAVIQSTRLTTIDAEAHVVVRLTRFTQENDFLKRYGDLGEDELSETTSSIPQRLLMMNGDLVDEHVRDEPLTNAATQIANLAPGAEVALEAAFLAVLTRRPTAEEQAHFLPRLAAEGAVRREAIEDLYWALLNSGEFAWNH